MGVIDDLVFDIGMNDGSDTDYYLRKGFRVVAVEASPVLVDAGTARFAQEISSGRLSLLPIGMAAERGSLKFYRNLANDHWSSFDESYGCRDGTPFEVIEIDCLTLADVFKASGIPRYLKIDVEGMDKSILSQLARFDGARPTFTSIEEYGPSCLEDLRNCGYDRFQFVRQREKLITVDGIAGEGMLVEKSFSGVDSGPFGLDLPKHGWLPFDQAQYYFQYLIRQPDHRYVGPQYEWFDVHATNSQYLAISKQVNPV